MRVHHLDRIKPRSGGVFCAYLPWLDASTKTVAVYVLNEWTTA